MVAGIDERVEEGAILAALAARGFDLVVCEGGPRLLGGLIGAGLRRRAVPDDRPAGRGQDAALPRLALVEGLAFSIDEAPWASAWASVMRSGDHLFLRYRMSGPRTRRGDRAP